MSQEFLDNRLRGFFFFICTLTCFCCSSDIYVCFCFYFIAKNRLLNQGRKHNRSPSPESISPSKRNSSFPNAPFAESSHATTSAVTSASLSSNTSTAKNNNNNTPPPLPRDSRLGKYVEFDLSKLRNSKGGFLVDGERDANEDERERKQRRQVQMLREQRLKEAERTGLIHEPGKFLEKVSLNYLF